MTPKVKPVPKLIPGLLPRAVVRATIFGDIMKNYGLPDNVIDIAQSGLMSGEIVGITICGYAPSGALRERSVTTFAALTNNDDMSVDVSNGRTMIEAVSRKFAHAVAASVALMVRQRLQIQYNFHIAEHCNAMEVCRKYGLAYDNTPVDPQQMRQLFAVSPGWDRGIRFSHETAVR